MVGFPSVFLSVRLCYFHVAVNVTAGILVR